MSFSIDDKGLIKWKKTFADMGIQYETDDEYREAAFNLVGYFDTLVQMDLKQKEDSKHNAPCGEQKPYNY